MEIDRALLPPARCLPAMPPGTLPGTSADQAKRHTARRVVIVAWRDVASPQAGGSELLVDQLATGLTARGDRVDILVEHPITEAA